jgi:hypothetical protein
MMINLLRYEECKEARVCVGGEGERVRGVKARVQRIKEEEGLRSPANQRDKQVGD